ncbi:MAG: hypothetical protein GQ564_00465 [Bacteroidales bacterium]|nr:hypothetical protein [Bacteroidales bacterium]
MQTNGIKQLQELKSKLGNQKMSVLVGAGFSRNVDNIFPDWKGLLFDMTYYLFENEIEEKFQQKCQNSNVRQNRNQFIEDKVEYYIRSKGYLEIVSLFIKSKGYREAVTAYIEEKTPRIVEDEGKRFLTNKLKGKINKIELKDSMLLLHRKLVNIPWNNIYTTNYDEMLDIVVDKQTIENIEKEKAEINSNIESLYFDISQLKVEIEDEENSFNDKRLKEGKSRIPWEKGIMVYSIIKEEDRNESNFQEIYNKLNQKKGELRSKESLLKSRNELYQSLEKAHDRQLSVVKKSSQLGIKRNNNLIKLHGSIRNDSDRYGFDGDIKIQYIIAKEDYETYPVKHEAFTQLMRISLLQESFCLIGFSGDDTNFVEWIKWVRDVLDKEEKTKEEYKIYLINVDPSHSSISEDRKLFYSNHGIFQIPIMEPNVIQFLESETKEFLSSASKKNPREVIDLFLNYLNKGYDINIPRAIFELRQIKKYNELWDTINIPYQGDINIELIIKNAESIISLKRFNRLPSISSTYSRVKTELVYRLPELLHQTTSQNQKDHLIELALIAFQDIFLPIHVMHEDGDFKTIKGAIEENTKFKDEFELLQLRKYVLKGDLNNVNLYFKDKDQMSDRERYELALSLAFTFDFEKLKDQLNIWKPDEHWCIKKAGLLVLFNSEEARKLIEDGLENIEYSQEKLYAYNLLRYVRQNINYGGNNDLFDLIELYKREGLKDISSNLEYIIDSLKSKPEKIKPYGQDRFSISNNFSYSNGVTDDGLAIQFIQILIEGGLPLSLSRVHLKGHEITYPVLRRLFDRYPYPALFYCLQYSNEDFIKRVGQDYASSELLKNDLPQIIVQVLKAYVNNETPPMFKQEIIRFSSELFIAVDPEYWESLFIDIWLGDVFQKYVYDDSRSPEKSWVESALPFLQKKESIQEVIRLTIKNSDQENAINFLYKLDKNKLLEEFGSNLQTTEITEHLNKLIDSVISQELSWFIIGNLHEILNDKQKAKVQKIISGYNYSIIKDERLWRVFVALADENTLVTDNFKHGVLISNKLWNAGFHDDGSVSGKVEYIELSRFSKSVYNPTGIAWTMEEALVLFDKLVEEFQKIEYFLTKRPDHDFRFILSEMFSFLKTESNNLKDHQLYEEVFAIVQALYIKYRGYKDLIIGLSSSDKSTVVWALSELSNEIRQGNKNNSNHTELMILLNKVLFQADPAIEASLNYLSTWAFDEKNMRIFKPYEQTFVLILKKYNEQELQECDKSFVLEQLIRIAIVLEKWGVQDEIIKIYQEKKINSNFNNIKYGLF